MKLSKRVAIYVPSTVDAKEAADTSAELRNIASFLSSTFGGATITDATGCWQSTEHGLIEEKIHIIFSFTTPSELRRNRAAVLERARNLRDTLRQESVAVELDGALNLV